MALFGNFCGIHVLVVYNIIHTIIDIFLKLYATLLKNSSFVNAVMPAKPKFGERTKTSHPLINDEERNRV